MNSLNDWNTLGMRASQSHTTKLENAVAPSQWVHSRLPVGPNADRLFLDLRPIPTLTASVMGMAHCAVTLGQEALNKRVHHDGIDLQDRRPGRMAMRLLTLDALAAFGRRGFGSKG